MARVGIYGGSFDPIHFGHLNLALEMIESGVVDEVWFCPVRTNPLKQGKESTAPELRLKLVLLALKGVPNCFATDIELRRPAPSYTVDTLRALIAEHPEHQFSLIMGDDTILHYSEWREPEEIVRLVPIWIGRRTLHTIDWNKVSKDPKMIQQLQKGVVPTRFLDISATEIRKRLRRGQYCGHLVPAPVLDEIAKHQLYLNTYD